MSEGQEIRTGSIRWGFPPGAARQHGTVPPPLQANSGAPMTRRESMRLRSSVLGCTSDDGLQTLDCPCIIRLGLSFPPGADPVDWMHELLAAAGFQHPEDLREQFRIPDGSFVCRTPDEPKRLAADAARTARVLEQGLLLGLCTAHCFDPLRSVMWTQASLTRALDLYDTRGFYA